MLGLHPARTLPAPLQLFPGTKSDLLSMKTAAVNNIHPEHLRARSPRGYAGYRLPGDAAGRAGAPRPQEGYSGWEQGAEVCLCVPWHIPELEFFLIMAMFSHRSQILLPL